MELQRQVPKCLGGQMACRNGWGPNAIRQGPRDGKRLRSRARQAPDGGAVSARDIARHQFLAKSQTRAAMQLQRPSLGRTLYRSENQEVRYLATLQRLTNGKNRGDNHAVDEALIADQKCRSCTTVHIRRYEPQPRHDGRAHAGLPRRIS